MPYSFYYITLSKGHSVVFYKGCKLCIVKLFIFIIKHIRLLKVGVAVHCFQMLWTLRKT